MPRRRASTGAARRYAPCALWLLCIAAAHADVLIGPNGERLPGRVVEEKNGVLTFESDFLGRIQVPSDRARVERDPTPAAAVAAQAPVATAPAAATTPSAPRWSSDVALKLGQDRGSLKVPEDILDASWKTSRRSDDGEIVGTLNYKLKRSQGTLQNNDLLGSLSYDRFLSPEHFVTGRMLGVSELRTDGYDTTGVAAAAWGWRLWEGPGRYLRIGPALGYLSLHRDDQKFDGAAVGLYARTLYPTWGNATVEAELEMMDAAGGNRYAILQARLKRPLTERLYIAVDWVYTKSHVQVESGIISQWRWVVGWTFDPRPQPLP